MLAGTQFFERQLTVVCRGAQFIDYRGPERQVALKKLSVFRAFAFQKHRYKLSRRVFEKKPCCSLLPLIPYLDTIFAVV